MKTNRELVLAEVNEMLQSVAYLSRYVAPKLLSERIDEFRSALTKAEEDLLLARRVLRED